MKIPDYKNLMSTLRTKTTSYFFEKKQNKRKTRRLVHS